VLVRFSINRGGRVLNARVARSSGFQDLDNEAINAVKRASPLPLPPNLISPLRLTFHQPVVFQASGCQGIGPQPAGQKRKQP
jgi:protein TonB